MRKRILGMRSMIAGLAALAVSSPALAGEKPEVFVQLGHTKAVTAVALTPEGRYALSGSVDTTIKVWELESGKEVRTLSKATRRITALAISPDGKRALSGDEDYKNNLKLWDIASGKLIKTFIGHQGGMESITSVAFSPDGKVALSGGGYDKTIKLWDIESGSEVRTLTGLNTRVSSIAVSPDGKVVVAGTRDNSVTMEESPDGTSVEVRKKSKDATIGLWELDTGTQLKAFNQGNGWVEAIAVSPDGKFAISGDYDDNARMWDLLEGREIKSFDTHGVSSIAISPDGKYALFGGVMQFDLWDLAAATKIKSFKGLSGWVRSLAFGSDGKTALSGDDSKTPKLWDLSSGKELRAFGGYAQAVASIAISRDGQNLLLGKASGLLNFWDVKKGRQTKTIKHTLGVQTVAISRNGATAVAGGWDFPAHATTLKLWNIESGQELQAFRRKESYWVHAAAITPDEKSVLWSSGSTLILSDIKTGKETKTFVGHKTEIQDLEMSSDGRYAISSDALALKVWNIAAKKPIKNIESGKGVFGADGKTVLYARMDFDRSKLVFHFWDLRTNQERKLFEVDFKSLVQGISWLALSADNRLVFWADKQILRIWEISSGKEVRSFEGDLNGFSSIKLSADEKHAYASGMDGTTRVWEISSGKEIARFISFTDNEWIVITPEGYYNASPQGDRFLNVRLGSNVYGIENYRETFFRPDLVALALAGTSLRDYGNIADVQQPPQVSIVNTPSSVSTEEVSLTLKIEDRGGGIGDVRLFLNGSAVVQDNSRGIKVVAKTGQAVFKTYTIKVANGQNSIRAVVFNSANSMQSNDAQHEVLAALKTLTPPSLHALVVGINEFKNPKLQLKYSVADAQLFATTLQGAATGLYQRITIDKLLTQEETSRESILQKLKSYQALKPDDVFVLYMASHGTVDDGEYFLITSNVGSTRTEKLKTDAISQSAMKELIANIPATKKFIVLDTCSAGALGDAIQVAVLTRGMSEDTAIKILSRAMGSTILSASTSAQEALEGYNQHGLFTFVLTEGMQGKADKGGSGFVKTTDLADYVDSEVPALAEKIFRRAQYPTISISGQGFPIGKTIRGAP